MSKKKTIAVIGLGAFGLNLVRDLKKLKATVIAIDKDPSKVSLVGEVADRTFICDSSDGSALEEIGIDKVDCAIVAMGQGDSNGVVSTITTTLALNKLGISNVIVRLDNETHNDVLNEIGATMIFTPLKMASERLSNIVLADNYEDYFNISDDYSVLQMEVSDDFEEIKLLDLNTPETYGVIIVLIRRDEKVFMPRGTDTIKANDVVFAFGTKENANKLAKKLTK